MVLFTVLMGLIKLQDKHHFTPHGSVPLLSRRTDKEIALRLYKRSLTLDALRIQIMTQAPKCPSSWSPVEQIPWFA